MATDRKVTVRQKLASRVRLAAPTLAYHREACTRVAKAIAELGPFVKVTVRPATGSVIVEGEPGTLAADALARRLEELVGAEHDDQGRPLAGLGPEHQPGATRIARAVAHAVAGINADVRASLDERADLGTILPVVFLLGGLGELGTTGKMPFPSWFNLLWWSLRSFMTFNIEAVEDEIHHDEHAPVQECVDAL